MAGLRADMFHLLGIARAHNARVCILFGLGGVKGWGAWLKIMSLDDFAVALSPA